MRVVVVGAGVVGVTTAWFLARHGCAVTVLERAAGVAQGTSQANAGMLTPSMADPWNAPGVLWHLLGWLGREDAPFLLRLRALPSLVGWGLQFLRESRPTRYAANLGKNLRLATYSLGVLRQLRAELGLRYDERANGTLKVFRTQEALDAAGARTELLAQLGLPLQVLAPADVARVEPSLAPVAARLAGGVLCPADESGDAHLFTEALARAALGAGVTFEFDADVAGFDVAGARLTAVRTLRGAHPADAVVVAAGTWSPRLLAPLGARLPVRPVKGYSLTLPLGAWATPPSRPVIDDALHIAATPLGARLRVAGTAEMAGEDRELTPARLDNLHTLLGELFPAFTRHVDRARAAPWAGLRPVTPDGVPRIGRLGCENLFVNAGHGHLGWTLAAGSSQLLADIICGKPPALDPVPYDAQRRN